MSRAKRKWLRRYSEAMRLHFPWLAWGHRANVAQYREMKHRGRMCGMVRVPFNA